MAVKVDLFMVLLLSFLHFVTNLEIKKISVISVTTVVGYTVSLPCDVTHSPGDSIYLVLWFNDNLTTPIYSYDVRPALKGDLDHWADDQVLGNRATLDVSRSPALLNLSNVKESDGGFYKCRVDFRAAPTKNTRVNLHVIVPPSEVEILVGNRKVQSVVGPFQEGETVNLTCVAKGGKPAPKVIWYSDNRIIDDEMDDPEESPVVGSPSNTLTLWNLTRENLKQMLTCEAPNNNITDPLSAVVMIDMNLAPLSIHILSPSDTLSAGREYSLVCDLRGSRPPPTITWWKGMKRVQGASETTSSDGNVTTSTLKLIPQPAEDGTTIICRAENTATLSVLEEQYPLSVHFIPEATIELGSNLDPKNIKEGDDVYFECKIHAQPKAYKVSFKHNNRELQHNISAKIILSNQSLVLQEVSRLQAGLYTCHASNIEGDGVATPINLDIKFAPVCAPEQLVTYGVAKDEDAEVSCHVQANPPSSEFKWTFNNTADTIDVPHGRYTSSDTRSVITYTPITELDYGTLLCWASNVIGTQQEPCLFHIVPAGKPDSPTNCSVGNQTSYSFTVFCRPGFDGGLKQVFLLQATASSGSHILNFTNGEPVFKVRDATPGTTYQVRVWAANDKGASPSQHLRAFTLKPNSDLHANYVGPLDAEVREGNTPASEDGDETPLPLDSPGLPALVSVVLGASAGVLIIVVILILLIRFRNRRPPPPPPPQRHSHSPPTKATSSSSPNIQIKSPVCARTKTPTTLCPEHEMQRNSGRSQSTTLLCADYD